MDVSNTYTSSQPTSQTPTDAGGMVDYDTFLQLLLAQMKNQDPTSPTDSTEWVAQFATFSQVEQSMMTNQNLVAMLSQMAISQADGIIGKTITSADGTVTGEVKSVHIVTGGAVAELTNGKFVLLEPGVEVKATGPDAPDETPPEEDEGDTDTEAA